ncbi:MAG: hypothetical protein GY906_14800 [bacterium]|nr:hypothetical protein [bacterium]
MNESVVTLDCKHCGEKLLPFELPEAAGFETAFQLACFNDECPYYQRGWEHMQENYAVRCSYRYRIDPANGSASPLAVWSADAIKDRIMDVDVSLEAAEDDAAPASQEGDGDE